MRRYFLACVLALLVAAPVHAAQPTVALLSYTDASMSDTVISSTMSSGQAVGVLIMKLSTSNRSFTVTDDSGANDYGTSTPEVSTGNCNSARCTLFFVDYSVTGGTFNITVDQSSTFVDYGVYVFTFTCGTSCAQDTESFITNASGTSHPTSADTTVIDTSANAAVLSGCAWGGAAGTETVPTGWEEAADTHATDIVYAAYEDDQATAFTDERGTATTQNSVTSSCIIVSVKDTGAGSPAAPTRGLLGVGK